MHGAATAAILMSFIAANNLGALQQTVIKETCGEPFRIDAQLELSIGGSDDPGRVAETEYFATNSEGQVVIHNQNIGHVFSSGGAFLRAFGRAGDGPGEYRSVRGLYVGPGDTTYILDQRTARMTVLSPDFDVIETRHLGLRPWMGVRLPSGSWILNGNAATEERIGWPLHLLARDGSIIRSFGATTPVYRADIVFAGLRELAAAGEDRVWAAFKNEYRVELWDTANRPLRSLVRDVPWFRPWYRSEAFAPDAPFKPIVRHIHVDRAGVLWVIVVVAKSNWSDFLTESRPGVYMVEEPFHRALQVVVEAVDTERACVLAALRPGAYLIDALSDDRFMAYHETLDGVPYLQVWRLRLIRSSQ